MQDPAAMARGMMALQAQAQASIADFRVSLAEQGLGFSDGDLALLAAAAEAAPTPAPGSVPDLDRDDLEAMTRRATEAVYPEDGLPPDDPRLEPVAGVSLVEQAVAARAIGWSTDPAVEQRVLEALGIDPASWPAASAEWRQRVTDDQVLAVLYGQLFAAADPLPRADAAR